MYKCWDVLSGSDRPYHCLVSLFSAQHSNREGWKLERVPPVSREITGTELVPWVRPERIIEQSFLKSIQEKVDNTGFSAWTSKAFLCVCVHTYVGYRILIMPFINFFC